MKGDPSLQPLTHIGVSLIVSSAPHPHYNIRRKETLQKHFLSCPLPGKQLLVLSDGRMQVLSLAAGTDLVYFSRSQTQGLSEGTVLIVCAVDMGLVEGRMWEAPQQSVEAMMTLFRLWVCSSPLQGPRDNTHAAYKGPARPEQTNQTSGLTALQSLYKTDAPCPLS